MSVYGFRKNAQPNEHLSLVADACVHVGGGVAAEYLGREEGGVDDGCGEGDEGCVQVYGHAESVREEVRYIRFSLFYWKLADPGCRV